MFSYIWYALVVVFIGYAGILINKKNWLLFLAYVEIVYNGILLLFLFVGTYAHDVTGGIYFLVVMALAAAEAVVGLVLAVVYQKTGSDLTLENLSLLSG